MAIVEMNKTFLFDIDSPETVSPYVQDKLLSANGNLQPGGQAIDDTFTRIGSLTIDARGAKYAKLDLGITPGTSTSIDIQLVYGLSATGGFVSEVTNKEVATDLTTRSEAVNRLQAGAIDHAYDFNLLGGAFRYIEFQIKDSADGTGVIDRAIVTLVY